MSAYSVIACGSCVRNDPWIEVYWSICIHFNLGGLVQLSLIGEHVSICLQCDDRVSHCPPTNARVGYPLEAVSFGILQASQSGFRREREKLESKWSGILNLRAIQLTPRTKLEPSLASSETSMARYATAGGSVAPPPAALCWTQENKACFPSRWRVVVLAAGTIA